MHPLIEEIKRASEGAIQRTALRRWQQQLEHEIQPKLDRLEVLERENAELREKLDGLVEERYGDQPIRESARRKRHAEAV